MSKLLFALDTPEWAKNFGVTEHGFGVLQSASTYPTLGQQETYIKDNAKRLEQPGILNALNHARDKGLL